MAGVVAGVSRERASHVFKYMPLRLVFAYEHLYYVQQGYHCLVLTYEQSLEDLMTNL